MATRVNNRRIAYTGDAGRGINIGSRPIRELDTKQVAHSSKVDPCTWVEIRQHAPASQESSRCIGIVHSLLDLLEPYLRLSPIVSPITSHGHHVPSSPSPRDTPSPRLRNPPNPHRDCCGPLPMAQPLRVFTHSRRLHRALHLHTHLPRDTAHGPGHQRATALGPRALVLRCPLLLRGAAVPGLVGGHGPQGRSAGAGEDAVGGHPTACERVDSGEAGGGCRG